MTVIIKTQNQFTEQRGFCQPGSLEESLTANIKTSFRQLYRLTEGLLPTDCI
jgi:hypothetical protein